MFDLTIYRKKYSAYKQYSDKINSTIRKIGMTNMREFDSCRWILIRLQNQYHLKNKFTYQKSFAIINFTSNKLWDRSEILFRSIFYWILYIFFIGLYFKLLKYIILIILSYYFLNLVYTTYKARPYNTDNRSSSYLGSRTQT